MVPPGRSLGWVAILAVLVLVCLSRGFEINPIRRGLDPSYVYALNHATAHHFSWGRDFVSTYGPYGFYISTLDIADLPARKLALALLLAAGAGVAATLVVWRETDLPLGLRLISLGLLLYAFAIQTLEYQVIGLLVLLLLFAVREESAKGLIAFGSAGLLAGFCMLIKFSLGFGALFTVAIGGLTSGRLRLALSRGGVALAGVVAGLLGGWQLYQGSPSGLSAFLGSGWDMAGGYSSAMSIAPEDWEIGVGAFLVWIVLLVAWVASWRARRPLLSLAVLAMPLFVAWKHSIVRQDVHVKILVLFGLFAMAILLLDAAVLQRWRRAVPVVALLAALLATSWYSLPAGTLERVRKAPRGSCPVNTLADSLLQPLRLCGLRRIAEWTDPVAMRSRLEAETRAELRGDVLPASIRSRIGSAAGRRVPVGDRLRAGQRPGPGEPADAGLVQRVHRRPRPARRRVLRVGSPTAVSPLALRLRARALPSGASTSATCSGTSPGPSSRSWIATISSRLLPGSSSSSHEPVSLRRTRADPAGRRGPGTRGSTSPATAGILLAHAAIKPRAAARAVRTLFRESPVFVSLRFSSGEVARFRIVPESAASGFWVSPFAYAAGDLPRLLAQGEGRTVVAIRFELGRVARLYEPVAVTWSHLGLADATWAGPAR